MVQVPVYKVKTFYSGTRVGSGSLCVHRFCYFWSDPLLSSGGRGTPHMKGVGMLVGNFELNPYKRPIWPWPKLFLTPKRDYVKTQTNEKTWIT